jgi:hypothetical protein
MGMHANWFLCCAIVVGLAAAPAGVAPRAGELEVRQGNGGVPCFTISEAQERRTGAPAFQSISVADSGPGARTVMWRMALPATRSFPVSFRMCIPYAGRLPVLPQTAAAPLMPGRPYEVTMEARADPAAGAPRMYRARFCLVRQATGELDVRRLGGDAKARQACAP